VRAQSLSSILLSVLIMVSLLAPATPLLAKPTDRGGQETHKRLLEEALPLVNPEELPLLDNSYPPENDSNIQRENFVLSSFDDSLTSGSLASPNGVLEIRSEAVQGVAGSGVDPLYCRVFCPPYNQWGYYATRDANYGGFWRYDANKETGLVCADVFTFSGGFALGTLQKLIFTPEGSGNAFVRANIRYGATTETSGIGMNAEVGSMWVLDSKVVGINSLSKTWSGLDQALSSILLSAASYFFGGVPAEVIDVLETIGSVNDLLNFFRTLTLTDPGSINSTSIGGSTYVEKGKPQNMWFGLWAQAYNGLGTSRALIVGMIESVEVWAPDTTAPRPPHMLSPENNAVFGTREINFVKFVLEDRDNVNDWSGVSYYTIEIDDSPDFGSPIRTVNSTGPSQTVTLPDNMTYYWRVRATDRAGNIGPWSSVRQFTIKDLTPPPTPALLSPSNGSILSVQTPTLDWSDVTDPSGVTYDLQVDDSSSFTSPNINKTGLAPSSYTLSSGEALADGVYWWRVRAVDGVGNPGGWSSAWQFSIGVSPWFWSYQTGGSVHSVAISSDGNYIAGVSDDGNVYLFGRASNIPLWSYQMGGWPAQVSISSDGNYIAVAQDWNYLYLFSRSSSDPLWRYEYEDFWSVAISSNGNYIVAGELDGKVYLFNRSSSTPLWTYQTGDGTIGNSWVSSVAISSDGSYLAAGSFDNKVYLFSRSSSTPLWSYQTNNNIVSVSISSDGSYIAAGNKDGKVYLFSKSSSTPLWAYQTAGGVSSVSISSDGSYIAAGSSGWDGKVYFFSRSSSTPLWTYQTGGYGVASVSISSDGSYIVAGGSQYNYRVYLFSRSSSIPLGSYYAGDPNNIFVSVSISSDGSRIAGGGWGGKIYYFGYLRYPPMPSLLSPPGCSILDNSTPAFDWSDVTDPSGVTYDFRIYRGVWEHLVCEITGLASSSYTLSSSEALADNLYYWGVKAVNGAGCETDFTYWSLGIATSPPHTTLNPYSPDPTSDNTPTYSGTTSDATILDNVVDIEYRVDGGPWMEVDPFVPATSVSFTFTTQPLADGLHVIEVRAEDAMGHWENSYASDELTVDAVPARDVEVSISPSYQSWINGSTQYYTVTVTNTGENSDNYILENSDDAGWNLQLSNNLLKNVAPGENRTVTLFVTIPENAKPGVGDNITVIAISQSDSQVKDNDSCVANVGIFRAVWVWISPDENNAPPSENVTFEITVKNVGNEVDNYNLDASDNLGWSLLLDHNLLENVFPRENRVITLTVAIPENAEPGARDNITVTATSRENENITYNATCIAHNPPRRYVAAGIIPSENCRHGTWYSGNPGENINLIVIVVNAGIENDSYDLNVEDNAGWPMTLSENLFANMIYGEIRTANLSVTVPDNAEPGNEDNLTVIVTSKENLEVSDSINSVIISAIIPGVEVSVMPSRQSEAPGETITYTVTVRNTGNIEDSYALRKSDDAGWLQETMELISIPPGENLTTMLTVTIPEDAELGAEDNITITATSLTDFSVSDSATCIAAGPVAGPNLIAGWNLVCFTVASENDTPANIFAGQTYYIWKWDAVNKKYVSPLSTAPVELGVGYWIWVGYDQTVTTSGVPVENYSIDLVAGWNMVGFPVTSSNTTPANLFAGQTYYIWKWDPVHTKYVSPSPTAPVDLGVGYWIWVDHDQTENIPFRGVQVVILPPNQDNLRGGTLRYTVTVTNAGNVTDNYTLKKLDNLGWALSIENEVTVPAGGSENVILTVTIPSNAPYNVWDNIWVVAVSQADNMYMNSDNCVARAMPPEGNPGVSISPENQDNLRGGTLRYTVTITNPTTFSQDTYKLQEWDDLGWTISIPGTVMVPAGGSENVILTVTIPSNAPYNVWDNIWVRATSQADSTFENSDNCRARAVESALQLVAGWNLVGFTVASENDTPDNILAGQTYYIWKWDPVHKKYVNPQSDQPVELGVGYWVWAGHDQTVYVPL